MKIGFTGNQEGMSKNQTEGLRRELEKLQATELHHGDCIGADAEADQIARELGLSVVIHPPNNPNKRAWCARLGDIEYEEKPYLVRNHDIVDAVDVMFAAPKTMTEELRSGTWATIRYARKKHLNIYILVR